MSYTSFDFPHTHFYDDDLRELLKKVFELNNDVKNFVSVNAIKYANPIQWDITRQYEKNTIVIDPLTGTAYISVAAVPSGVALTREEFWTPVFDLGQFVVRASKNFTTRYEEETTLTATFNSAAGEWIVWGDTLYVANVNITAGDSYVIDGNIRHITVEEVKNAIMQLIANNYDAIITMIGDLNDLTTTEKNNIVAAINELVTGLSDEVQARKDADSGLSNRIDGEVQAITDAVNDLNDTLSNRINDEVQRRTDAVNGIIDGKTAFSKLNAPNDLVFKAPTVHSRYFKYLPFTDNADPANNFNLLVANDDIDLIGSGMYVNVILYGADNTGIEDSTQAIQNAINDAAGGGVVYFPKGTYKITSTLTMQHRVSLLGDSMRGSILMFDFAGHVGINFVGKDIRGTFISRLSVVRATKDTVPTSTYPAWLKDAGLLFGCVTNEYNSAILTIEDVFIQNWRMGISGAAHHGESNGIGLFDSYLKNVWVDNCVSFGIALGGSGNVIIEPRVTLNGGGIAFIHVSDESFDGCSILGGVFVQSNGYDFTFRDSGQFRPIVMDSVWFEQSGAGIVNVPFANTRLMNLTLIGCMFNASTTLYDLFTMANVAAGVIEMLNDTFYSTIAGGNTNVVFPTTTTSVKGVARDCVKIDYQGNYSIYDKLT